MRSFITCCLPVSFNNVPSVMTANNVGSDDRVSPVLLPQMSQRTMLSADASNSALQPRSDLLPDLIRVTAIEDPCSTVPSTAPPVGHQAPPWHPSPSLSWSQAGHEQSSVVDAMLEGVRGLLHSEGGVTTTFTNTRTPSESTLLMRSPVLTSPSPSVMTNAGSGLIEHHGRHAIDASGGDYPPAAAPGPPAGVLMQAVSVANSSQSSVLLVPNQPGLPASGSTATTNTTTTTTISSSPRQSLGAARNRSCTPVVAGGTTGTSTRRRPSPRPCSSSNRRRTSSTSTGSSRLLGVSGLATSVGSAWSGGGRVIMDRESGGSGGAAGSGSAAGLALTNYASGATTSSSPATTTTLQLTPLPEATGPLAGPLVPSRLRTSAEVMVGVGLPAPGLHSGPLPRPASFPHRNQTPASATISVQTGARMYLAVNAPPASRIELQPPTVASVEAADRIAAAHTTHYTAMQSEVAQAVAVVATATLPATAASIATATPTTRNATAISPIQVELGSTLSDPFTGGTARSPDLYGSAPGSTGETSALPGVADSDDAVAITGSVPMDGPTARPGAHLARELERPQRLLEAPLLPLLPLTTAPEAMASTSQLPLCRLSGLLADVTNAAQPLPLAMGSGRASIITGVWRGLPVVAKIMCSSSLSPDGAVMMAARRVGVHAHRHLVHVYGIRTAQVDQASVWTLVPEPRRTSRAFAQALAHLDRPHERLGPARGAPEPVPKPHPAAAATMNPLVATLLRSPTVTATTSGLSNGSLAVATSRLPPRRCMTGETAAVAATGALAQMSAGPSPPLHAGKLQLLQRAETPPAMTAASGSGGGGSGGGWGGGMVGIDGGSEAPNPTTGPATTTILSKAAAAAVRGTSTCLGSPPTMPHLIPQAAAGSGGFERRRSPSPPAAPPLQPLQHVLGLSDREMATSPRRMALAAVRPRPGEHIAVMIMEHCEMGDLASLLSLQFNPFRPNRRWSPYMAARAILRCAREVAAALSHLHRRGLMHGGVKPTNVLLVSSQSDLRCFEVKLADACFSGTWLDDCGPIASSTGLLYNSPEALREGPSPPADVWAFGLLLLAMVSAPQPPFAGEPTVPLLLKIAETAYRPPWPQPCPAGPMVAPLQALYERCTRPDPAERPTIEQVYVELRALEAQVRNEKRSGSSGSGSGGGGGGGDRACGTAPIMRPPPSGRPSLGSPSAAEAVGEGALRAQLQDRAGPMAASLANVDMEEAYGSAVRVMEAFGDNYREGAGEATAGLQGSVSTASAWSGDLSGSSQLSPLPPMSSQQQEQHHRGHHHYHHDSRDRQQQEEQQQEQ